MDNKITCCILYYLGSFLLIYSIYIYTIFWGGNKLSVYASAFEIILCCIPYVYRYTHAHNYSDESGTRNLNFPSFGNSMVLQFGPNLNPQFSLICIFNAKEFYRLIPGTQKSDFKVPDSSLRIKCTTHAVNNEKRIIKFDIHCVDYYLHTVYSM